MVPETGAEWAPKLAQNGPNTGPAMDPKWARNGPKIGPKTEPKMDQKWGPGLTQNGAQKWAQNGARNLPWKTPRGILAARKRPQIDVHGPDSERPFGAVRLSELRIASVIGSVCSERTKTHYLITRGPLSASANAKNERIPGLRNFGQGPGRVGVVVGGGAI